MNEKKPTAEIIRQSVSEYLSRFQTPIMVPNNHEAVRIIREKKLENESVYCVLLSSCLGLLGIQKITSGYEKIAAITTREIASVALKENARIMLYAHITAKEQPERDAQVFKNLMKHNQALASVDVSVLGCCTITPKQYTLRTD